MKYFVCNNARKLLGSSGHSRRHHEGSGERLEERGERRQGEREDRRQGDREDRRQGEREERRQGDREVDKMISGVEALNVSSTDSTSTEVTPEDTFTKQIYH